MSSTMRTADESMVCSIGTKITRHGSLSTRLLDKRVYHSDSGHSNNGNAHDDEEVRRELSQSNSSGEACSERSQDRAERVVGEDRQSRQRAGTRQEGATG
jgi:hypothetical protein